MSVGAYMSADLERLTDVMRERRKVPDGVPATIAKGRKTRAEAKVKKAVRAACVLRDGYCRFNFFSPLSWAVTGQCDVTDRKPYPHRCVGPSEWAHLGAKKRARTRGMAPEVRHTTAHSAMLCRQAHRDYDAGRLRITALTRRGADGPLKFTRKK